MLDALTEAIPVTAGEARSYLARFLFRGDDVLKEVRLLSGGERSRLELALLGIQPSNLLLLDEPTNHLDIPAREAIESFMTGSPATLLVVSHDRRLLETVCEKLWVVDDGRGRAVRWRVSRLADGRGRRLDGRGRPRSRGEAAPRRSADHDAGGNGDRHAAAAPPASTNGNGPLGHHPREPRQSPVPASSRSSPRMRTESSGRRSTPS